MATTSSASWEIWQSQSMHVSSSCHTCPLRDTSQQATPSSGWQWNSSTTGQSNRTIYLELVLHGIPDGVACLAIFQLLQCLDLTCIAHVLLQRLLRPLWQCLQHAQLNGHQHCCGRAHAEYSAELGTVSPRRVASGRRGTRRLPECSPGSDLSRLLQFHQERGCTCLNHTSVSSS